MVQKLNSVGEDRDGMLLVFKSLLDTRIRTAILYLTSFLFICLYLLFISIFIFIYILYLLFLFIFCLYENNKSLTKIVFF